MSFFLFSIINPYLGTLGYKIFGKQASSPWTYYTFSKHKALFFFFSFLLSFTLPSNTFTST